MFRLFFITNKPDIAIIAENAGVDRIWVDLEVLGKEERQHGLNTVKSKHSVADVGLLSNVLSKSKLIVRINKWNDNSKEEIDAVINAGAQIIMLPYWKTKEEVQQFIYYIDGRVKTNLLLETKEGVNCIDSVVDLDGIDEVHIGLNDLKISYGFSNMFEPYVNGLLEELSIKLKNKKIPFGIGGIGKIGLNLKPSPEQLLTEQYRLGSTATILSRTFCDTTSLTNTEIKGILFEGVNALRLKENEIAKFSTEQFEINRNNIKSAINMTINKDDTVN